MPKEKKEKKSKKAKKEKKGKKGKNQTTNSQQKTITEHIAICGHPSVVDNILKKMVDIEAFNGNVCVKYISEKGTDENGNLIGGTFSGYVGVYDIRYSETYDLLKNKVMPAIANSKGTASMMIGGQGLEYRIGGERVVAPITNTSNLGKQFNCPSIELISCAAEPMATGLLCLYVRTSKSNFDEGAVNTTNETKKKRKKEKKEKKSKKEKKDKKPKKEKKKK